MSAPAIFALPKPVNEPVRDYGPGSPEREQLRVRLAEMQRERIEIPLVIGGEEIRTGDTFEAVMPHDKDHVLADVHKGGPEHVEQAIDVKLKGETAKTKPSSGRYSIRFHMPGEEIGCSLISRCMYVTL